MRMTHGTRASWERDRTAIRAGGQACARMPVFFLAPAFLAVPWPLPAGWSVLGLPCERERVSWRALSRGGGVLLSSAQRSGAEAKRGCAANAPVHLTAASVVAAQGGPSAARSSAAINGSIGQPDGALDWWLHQQLCVDALLAQVRYLLCKTGVGDSLK